MGERIIFHIFPDGEEVDYYDPIATYVQGSLAEERRNSPGRRGKDLKEVKFVKRLNSKFRISLFDIFSGTVQEPKFESNKITSGSGLIENRLSRLGASYPNVPGLGIYIHGLQRLEQDSVVKKDGKISRTGPQTGKKIFDLLFWLSSCPEMDGHWKFELLNKIGKLVLNQRNVGKWMLNSTTILLMLGKNEVAYTFGEQLLQNKSAVQDSLRAGSLLAKKIFIQFYENTRIPYPKVRRRGYARSSPSQPNSNKAIREANSSIEYLVESGFLTKNIEKGGYDGMDEKKLDTEDLLLKIFTNSLESFEALQEETMERLGIRKQKINSQTNQGSSEENNSSSKENTSNSG